MEIKKAVTVLKSPEDLYRYWRQFDLLPHFMKNLEAVTPLGDRRSHWRAKGPADQLFEWDAEITEDQVNGRIAWRSLEGAEVDQTGMVILKKAPGDRGTEVRVRMNYHAPGGQIGVTAGSQTGGVIAWFSVRRRVRGHGKDGHNCGGGAGIGGRFGPEICKGEVPSRYDRPIGRYHSDIGRGTSPARRCGAGGAGRYHRSEAGGRCLPSGSGEIWPDRRPDQSCQPGGVERIVRTETGGV